MGLLKASMLPYSAQLYKSTNRSYQLKSYTVTKAPLLLNSSINAKQATYLKSFTYKIMSNLKQYNYPGVGEWASANLNYAQAVRVENRIICSGQGCELLLYTLQWKQEILICLIRGLG
jgi:hypothetical protein